jgi:predicted aldo/keto reductase-like oxidoreductase
MSVTQQDRKKRLLYILHLGFVEVRNLALAAGNQQIADLADALELLPRFVEDCTEEDQEMIRFVLKTYHEKYQSTFNYPARFDVCDPPERY